MKRLALLTVLVCLLLSSVAVAQRRHRGNAGGSHAAVRYDSNVNRYRDARGRFAKGPIGGFSSSPDLPLSASDFHPGPNSAAYETTSTPSGAGLVGSSTTVTGATTGGYPACLGSHPRFPRGAGYDERPDPGRVAGHRAAVSYDWIIVHSRRRGTPRSDEPAARATVPAAADYRLSGFYGTYSGGDKPVHVRGYVNSHGTYVAPYSRARPGHGSKRR